MTEKLCEAYRNGCKGEILAKLEAVEQRVRELSDKVDRNNVTVDANQLALKILQTNELKHMQSSIDVANEMAQKALKSKHAPLGAKEWGGIIISIITGITAIIVSLL